jgi:hypothetical protein
VKKIAPDAIINDNYDFLYNLLSELASPTSGNEETEDAARTHQGDKPSDKIIDWDTKGRVFYDFINIDMEVKELLKKRDEKSVGYHIEKLRPQVRINIIKGQHLVTIITSLYRGLGIISLQSVLWLLLFG